MGQFESRPEDPLEWAGLPSEPLNRSDATDLDAVMGAADAIDAGLGAEHSSIVIPTVPYLASSEQDRSGGAGDEADRES